MLRLPSTAVRGWASKKIAPMLGIRSRQKDYEDNRYPSSPEKSANATVYRNSFVLEHDESERLEDTYELVQGMELGAGGFGTVRKASLRGAETVARAVKTIQKSNCKAEELARCEIAILKRLDHPSICRLLETFEDNRHVYLVLELIHGRELFDEIIENGTLDEEWASGVMRQVFGALQYCHEQNVIHRDLKPENVMVSRSSCRKQDSNLQVVLIDFGMAIVQRSNCHDCMSIAGTHEYMAPEAARGQCSTSSDVWSAGVVLHAMLVGLLPDSHNVATGDNWAHVSVAARELVQQLLEVDPRKRITAADAAGHAWTRGASAHALLPKHVSKMMKNFVLFHGSNKLRQAALTALAMQLTKHHLIDYREQFIAIDSDGNGKISKQELVDSISVSSPFCPAEVLRWVESVFDSLDTDGSQEIEYTEWLAAAVHISTTQCEETMRAAFRVFDVNGDGHIDEREFARVLRQSPKDIASMLPQYDVNGDGVLDFEEFRNLLTAGVAAKSVPQPMSVSRGFTGNSCSSVSSGGSHFFPPSQMVSPLGGYMPLSPACAAPILVSI